MGEITFRSGTVLIVDDEEQIIQVLSEGLTQVGYQVISAQSGRNAYLTLVKHAHTQGAIGVKVIVCDWMMPNGTGIEFLQRIRKEVAHHDIPFILISGAVSMDKLSEALNHDADAVLFKPFTIEALIDKIDFAVHHREMKAIRKVVGPT